MENERQHLEMMAATIAVGCIAEHPTASDKTIALVAVNAARAIQAEVAASDGGTPELEADNG